MEEDGSYDGNSSVQREAEIAIRAALEKELDVSLGPTPGHLGVKLDGFAGGKRPICVEIWAHQGPAKSAQRHKVMTDMCKMLWVQKKLRTKCRKIFTVADRAAISFLDNSWQGQFAEAFGIERHVVEMPEEFRERIRDAQKRQYR